MKKLSTLFLALIGLAISANAQSPVFYPSNHVKILGKSNTDTLENALTGGFNHPMYGNVDLNMDGRQDLVVYDREVQNTGTILPFLSVKKGSTYRHVYAPQYTHLFPVIKGWARFADYDGDGKMDLFAYGETFGAPGCITAFKNVSTDSVRFQMVRLKVGAYSKSAPGFNKISANMTEIPAFSDIDNDGDMDILAFDPVFNTTIYYYRNVSKDSSWAMDSLKFALVDQCWGRFLEADTGVITTNFKCLQSISLHRSERKHDGSALSAIDMDGDGDKELLIGDASYGYLLLAKNDRLPASSPPKKWDTVGSSIAKFPATKPVNVANCVLASLVDVNADGKADMIGSPMEIFTRRRQISWYYENTGTSTLPVFTFRDSSFIESTMFDLGDNSAPCFLDYDSDGKMDMLLSVSGENKGTWTEQVYYYHNEGTSDKPIYKLANADFMGLSDDAFIYMTPTIGDVNNDGKRDLVIGSSNGKLRYYLNQSTGGFNFSASSDYISEDNIGNFLDAGDNSIPTIGDLDGDGKMDLLVGNKFGNLIYYQNIGTTSTPLFKKITENFANVGTHRELAPALGLIDGDDSLDLLIGSFNEPLRFYRNVSAATTNAVAETKLAYNLAQTAVNTISAQRTVPAIAQLDDDEMADLVIGSSRGGITVYTSKSHPYVLPPVGIGNAKQPSPLQITLYPNPANGNVHLALYDVKRTQPVSVIVSDMLGRVISQENYITPSGSFQRDIDVSGMANGVYTIRVVLPEENRSATKQLVITHP